MMRKFGTDKPELLEFQLGDSDKVHSIPLAGSMPADDLIRMSEVEDNDTEAFKLEYELLRKYIGDAADNLTAGDVLAIFRAWREESDKQGAEPGESSASSASSETTTAH